MFGAIALKALEVYAIPTPWLHQDTTTITLYGAYEDEPPGQGPVPPRPAYGHSQDGHDDLTQVLLSLGELCLIKAFCPKKREVAQEIDYEVLGVCCMPSAT